MSEINPWLFLVPVGGFVLFALIWWFYGIGRHIQWERVRESFRLQHERLERMFFEKASSTGLPRGLRWVSCAFSPDVEFAREKPGRQIVALAPVIVYFEAVEGGDMEDLPAVPLPRQGCAVLYFSRGEWTTTGRVIFNLLPGQIFEQFAGDFEHLRAKRC